jgi:hypothetical protein
MTRARGRYEVLLASDSLLSKWGFDDGGTPWEWIAYWEDLGGGWCATVPPYPLVAVVRAFLLPVIEQQVEVAEIGTSHNPVRAARVDGEDAEWCWDQPGRGPRLRPGHVLVAAEEIAARLGVVPP